MNTELKSQVSRNWKDRMHYSANAIYDRQLDRPIALAVGAILPLQTRDMNIFFFQMEGKLHNGVGE